MANLLKSQDNLHGNTYKVKIILKRHCYSKTLDIAIK